LGWMCGRGEILPSATNASFILAVGYSYGLDSVYSVVITDNLDDRIV